MKTYHVDYPYLSNFNYLGKYPFLRIIENQNIYYGFIDKSIQIINFHHQPILCITIFDEYQVPNKYLKIFKQATKLIKGIEFVLLFVNQNQYLCLGKTSSGFISLVILTIELNSNGYYEIYHIKDVINEFNYCGLTTKKHISFGSFDSSSKKL
ncbi:MAG: hypothetical protein ACI4U3_06540 [Traorella sp.]